MTRTIDTHHDGHGLNESIIIHADGPKESSAAYEYTMTMLDRDGAGLVVASIQFQQGPRNEAGAVAGITEGALYAVLIDRLKGFQAGPFACRENAIQLTKLEECAMWARARADERAKRGVLGKSEK